MDFKAKYDISYTHLPFGISIAGYIFFQILREVIEYFMSRCKRIIMFLDDGLAWENDYDTAVKSSKQVNDELQKKCCIADDKCH